MIGPSLSEFFARGGEVKLVCSPKLQGSDIAALRNFSDIAAGNLTNQEYEPLITFLRNENFHLKLSRTTSSKQSQAMYHEKIGVFIDQYGDFVSFVGSLNETATAFSLNFESIHVFCSWKPEDHSRALNILADFEVLWANEQPGLDVRPWYQALDWLVDSQKPIEVDVDLVFSGPTQEIGAPALTTSAQIPTGLTLRRHQTTAIRNWFNNGLRGLFQMATGSGKTITALTASALLSNRHRQLLIVVACPYTNLVDQWSLEASKFGFSPIRCYGSHKRWIPELSMCLSLLNRGHTDVCFCIVTFSTLLGDTFLKSLQSSNVPTLFIADEVHGLATQQALIRLDSETNFDYRLGLSATPERWFDEEGTDAMQQYFGPVISDYGLKEALIDNVLVPYHYYPELVRLSSTEADAYIELSRKISALLSSNPNFELSEETSSLLFKRSRLLSSVQAKFTRLAELLIEQKKLEGTVKHTLIYCGDGRVETDPQEDEINQERRQIEFVSDLLNIDLNVSCAMYTAETRVEQRLKLQRDLASGELGAIAAIRCLDEGVDIPPTRTAYILASSRNPRQFIQRRGRILRRHDESNKKHATLYDFVVVPPDCSDERTWGIERSLLKRELDRIIEFSRLSRNESETLRRLRPLREKYNLLGYDGENK